jgi:hypothetical protein
MPNYKTDFSVLATIELNVLVEFTKSSKQWPPYDYLRNLTSTG